jgi:CheY-like chemotaxis protein
MEEVKKIYRILLVDDDEDDCSIFDELLKEVNDRIELVCIHTAHNITNTALELKPDLIFLDINMPEVDGIRCLKSLKGHQILKDIPVIMYTSSNYSKDIERAYTNGASLFLSKPAKIEQIKKAIKQILELNWNEASLITSSHFREGKYYAFQLN